MTEAQLLALFQSGTRYRKELLAMPLVMLAPILEHMTLRLNVRGKEAVGQLGVSAELSPYTPAKNASGDHTIDMRELETFLGNVVYEFDAYAISTSVYGNALSQAPAESNIAKAVAMEMVKVVSNGLRHNLFTAKRNAAGTKTADLFNGFATILDAEITKGTVADSKGNLADLGEISRANVVDVLMDMYLDAASEELQETDKIKMFLPTNVYNLYTKGYQDDFGHAPFNKEFKKTFLEGTDNRCELVPLANMSGTGKIILTDRGNMLVGVDQMSDAESVEIRRPDNPKAVQLFMKLFFGTQLETLSKERLLVGKFTTAPAA